MIARMLNICGLYLGPPEDLGAPARDNPAGFWENLKVVDNNERILSAFGGGWDLPPRFPDNWVDSGLLLGQREMALRLIRELGTHGTWGWKDPRTSLTLPFWRQLIPDLKVVVAIRNPVDIWRSLAARGHSSLALSSHLTLRYLESLRLTSETDGRIVVHYDAFFENPRYELQRLLGFLGLEVDPQVVEDACAQVRQNLRHTHSTLADLLHSDVSGSVIEEYVSLCREAGPHYQQVLAVDLQECFPPGEPQVDLAEWGAALKRASSGMVRSGSESVGELQVANIGDSEWGQEAKMQQLGRTVRALTVQVAAEKQAVRALSAQLAARDSHINDLTAAIKGIHGSRSWKLGQLLGRVYRWFWPRRPAN